MGGWEGDATLSGKRNVRETEAREITIKGFGAKIHQQEVTFNNGGVGRGVMYEAQADGGDGEKKWDFRARHSTQRSGRSGFGKENCGCL